MEIKKNASLRLENKRIPFILIGLLFAGSMTLASYSYKKGTDRFVKEKNLSNITKIEYEMEEIKEVEPPKEEPIITYTPPPSEEIKEKENSNEITKTTVVVIPPDIKIDSVTVVVVEEKIIDFPDIEASFLVGLLR